MGGCEMNIKSLNLMGILLASAAVVVACGGSGDDGAGSLSPFSVSPDELKMTSATASCPTGRIGYVTVIGGTAPYDLYTSSAGLALKSAAAASDADGAITRLANEGTQFSVWGVNANLCGESTVTVRDALGRSLPVKVTLAASGS
jgi:hypothetical protein